MQVLIGDSLARTAHLGWLHPVQDARAGLKGLPTRVTHPETP